MLTISNDLNISLLLVLRFKIESRLQGSEELRIKYINQQCFVVYFKINSKIKVYLSANIRFCFT